MMLTTATDTRAIQRDEARQKANEIRIAKAAIKRELKARRRDVRDVVADPPHCCQKMTITELLCALPRVGVPTAERICRGICRPNLQLQHMGDVTRGRLIAQIGQSAWWALPQPHGERVA